MKEINPQQRTIQQNKKCENCGVMFKKNRKFSSKQWVAAKYCSMECSGNKRLGTTHSLITRQKLSNAHKGTSKPWAGYYERTDKHKKEISERAIKFFSTERGLAQKQKLLLAHSGRKNSPEAIENMKMAQSLLTTYKGGEKTRKARKAFSQRMREFNKRANGGNYTLKQWEALKLVFQKTCPACFRSEPEINLTIDHIIPLSIGGNNGFDNIQPLCNSCNSKKHTKVIRYEPKTKNVAAK